MGGNAALVQKIQTRYGLYPLTYRNVSPTNILHAFVSLRCLFHWSIIRTAEYQFAPWKLHTYSEFFLAELMSVHRLEQKTFYYPRATHWRRVYTSNNAEHCGSVCERPCEHERDKSVVCFWIKLDRHVNHDEMLNFIACGGQRVKVTTDIYGNKLVNTIETKPLCVSSSNLADILTMVRGWTLLIFEVRVQGHIVHHWH